MKFFTIEPEVSISLGPNSVLERGIHPPVVHKLEVVFEGWLGNDILETFPCFIVTEKLRSKLVSCDFSGFHCIDVQAIKSELFEDLYPGKCLPKIFWMQVQGEAGKDDFGVNSELLLTISERALNTLKECNIDQCIIEPYEA